MQNNRQHKLNLNSHNEIANFATAIFNREIAPASEEAKGAGGIL